MKLLNVLLAFFLIADYDGFPLSSCWAQQQVPKPEHLDIEGCIQEDLVLADLNSNGAIDFKEYLTFINTYGKRVCWPPQTELTAEQTRTFSTLACLCQTLPGNDASCCQPLEENGKIPLAQDPDAITPQELRYLSIVCVETDNTQLPQCSAAPSVSSAPSGAPTNAPDDSTDPVSESLSSSSDLDSVVSASNKVTGTSDADPSALLPAGLESTSQANGMVGKAIRAVHFVTLTFSLQLLWWWCN